MMRNSLFRKLAADNIIRNEKSYVPYIVTCIVTVAIFYIVKSLSLNPSLEKMVGADTINYIMQLGSIITAFFALAFLLYANSFLVKRRKKEFAIFNILGMGKQHIAKTLAWELLYIFLMSVAVGLVLGIALDKVMFLLILKTIGGTITLGFFISLQAIVMTIILFVFVFLVVYMYSVRQIHNSNPIELMRDGSAGEKEPKTNWLFAILGVVSIGSGYWISISMDKPISKAVPYLFVAVLFVIIGTYMFFTASSIALLKTLRKWKNYYYNTKHFISVSNLIYRMRQNAIGLANICILSTMVLVMVSSTSSLIFGMDDIIQKQYPNDFDIYSDEADWRRSEESFDYIHQLQKEQNLSVTSETYYTYLIISAVNEKDCFDPIPFDTISGESNEVNFIFVSLDDYNASMGTNRVLKENEIMIYSNCKDFDNTVIRIFDKEYSVTEKLEQPLGNRIVSESEAYSCMVIVPDTEEINSLYMLQKKELGDLASNICYFYGFNSDANEVEQSHFYNSLMDGFTEKEYQGVVESKADAKSEQIGTYGGFFFIGIFLGTLFLMATVLIIYYKQISEGYDDKERFSVMQKIGMSKQEVKISIRSQVQTVFFLPLLSAGIHVAAAFPMISRILLRLNLDNTGLYLICTIVSFLIFSVIYIFVYYLTAKTYYKIMKIR